MHLDVDSYLAGVVGHSGCLVIDCKVEGPGGGCVYLDDGEGTDKEGFAVGLACRASPNFGDKRTNRRPREEAALGVDVGSWISVGGCRRCRFWGVAPLVGGV